MQQPARYSSQRNAVPFAVIYAFNCVSDYPNVFAYKPKPLQYTSPIFICEVKSVLNFASPLFASPLLHPSACFIFYFCYLRLFVPICSYLFSVMSIFLYLVFSIAFFRTGKYRQKWHFPAIYRAVSLVPPQSVEVESLPSLRR